MWKGDYMTDKKRGRPTVKKTDEKTIARGYLPTARFCLSFLAEHKDEIKQYREKHGDDRIIADYEALHNAETLSETYLKLTQAATDLRVSEHELSIADLLVTIPFTAAMIAHDLTLMGAAYYDIILEKEGK